MPSFDNVKTQLLSLREEYMRRIDAIEVETHPKEEAVEKTLPRRPLKVRTMMFLQLLMMKRN